MTVEELAWLADSFQAVGRQFKFALKALRQAFAAMACMAGGEARPPPAPAWTPLKIAPDRRPLLGGKAVARPFGRALGGQAVRG